MDNPNFVFFDVDETLLIFEYPPDTVKDMLIEVAPAVYALPHSKHIDQMKKHWARGHLVYVWSAGGVAWAKQAVELLGLQPYVSHVMAKPSWFYDDKTANEFMPEINRVYFDYKTGLEVKK